ncbi:unnamed protein product [Cunninghamella echinulata]
MNRQLNRLSSFSALCSIISKTQSTPLQFNIYDYSSYSGSYHPNNIYFNTPLDQISRWSSGSHDGTQYITLEFDKPVVASALLWGKFHRSHVCNVKEFKVYGGMDTNNMSELLSSQVLRNDNNLEIFKLRYSHQDLVFPVQYIKIVPVSTFSSNFNYSIWYIEIHGINDPVIIENVIKEYENYKEKETFRLCMKYFRQHNMMDVFNLLKNQTGIELENQLLSQLHTALVEDGDFEKVESLMDQADETYHIFQLFTDQSKYQPVWKQLQPIPTKNGQVPSGRGGHQMCIDDEHKRIYLHGGWNGKLNLADFWYYSIIENKWHLLSQDTGKDGGPTARSCHQICLDSSSRSIFVFGHVVDSHSSSITSHTADFYRYFIDSNQWVKIDDHTANHGGPELIFDHQMCVDTMGRKLYVFGGRTITGINMHQFSGLYSYDIENNTWEFIRNSLNDMLPLSSRSSISSIPNNNSSNNTTNDDNESTRSLPSQSTNNSSSETSPRSSRQIHTSISLQSRVGHSMLLDPDQQWLYIFGGECANESFYELHRYDIGTNMMKHVLPQHRRHRKNSAISIESPSSTLCKPSNNDINNSNTYDNHDNNPNNNNNNNNQNQNMDSDEEDCESQYSNGSYSNQITLSKTVPDLGYTQRATIDTRSQKVCVFSGYLQNSGSKTIKNSIWLYYIDRDIWEEIYVNERHHQHQSSSSSSSSSSGSSNYRHHLLKNKKETPSTLFSSTLSSSSSLYKLNLMNKKSNHLVYPTPRFSCQWIYDDTTKIHYLFGGDPHEYNKPDHRLNDLWTLKLIKPNIHDLRRRCKYLVRVQKFREICYEIEKNNRIDMISQALDFLQKQITPMVNQTDDQEKKILSQLCARLCFMEDITIGSDEDDDHNNDIIKMKHHNDTTCHLERTILYNTLIEYFPDHMKQPDGDISEAVTFK